MDEHIRVRREPSLSESCRAYIGKRLSLRFRGFAWTEVVGAHISEYDASAVFGTLVEVIPTEFFSQAGTATRGFRGRIAGPGHPFDGMHVIAGPMIALSAPPDACSEFDFKEHLSPEWRVWLAKTELVLPTRSYRELRGADMIAGYCTISEGLAPPIDWQTI